MLFLSGVYEKGERLDEDHAHIKNLNAFTDYILDGFKKMHDDK